MTHLPVAIPEVHTREVTIEVPDALVSLMNPESRRAAVDVTSRAARSAGISASQFAASAREQAGPLLENVSATTSAVAATAAKKGGELAASARDTSSVIALRAREDWIPTAREKLDEAGPVVAEGLQTSATRASALAAAVGATAQVGAEAAAEASSRAVRGAARATGSAISQVFSLFFWLSVVIWLLLRVFYPEKEQRERVYTRVRKLTGLEI